GSRTFAPLLLPKSPDYHSHGAPPLGVEGHTVVSRFPVAIRETDNMTKRIDFPLALGNPGLHVGLVEPRPLQRLSGLRIREKCIGVRIDQNAPRMPVYQPTEQLLQHLIRSGQRAIGPDL